MFKYSKSTALALAVLALTLGGNAMAGSNDGIDESLYSESGWSPFTSDENTDRIAVNIARPDMKSQLSSTTHTVSYDRPQPVRSVEPAVDLEDLYRD